MESVSTKRQAWFILTDLHAFHSLANRFDYFGEIKSIAERIERIVQNYVLDGYEPHLILAGDVTVKGSASDTLNDYAVQIMRYLFSFFKKKFLNLGNHEISYWKNNPVFKFIKDIEDKRILTNLPHIRGTSLVEELRVVPSLQFEDFEFAFCPYGFLPIRGDKKTSILIMHDNLLSEATYTKLSTLAVGYKIKRKFIPEDSFDYVFCGHQHMAYEKWKTGKTTIYNLSTLGRDNVSEVDDSFRERIIPVVLVEDNKFVDVVDEPIVLHKRSTIIDESKVATSRIKYADSKDRAELRASLDISRTKNPIEALLEDIDISERPDLKRIMELVLEGRLIEYNKL